jgi:predicted nuclease with TOPRIM domain
MTRREVFNFFNHFDKLRLPKESENHSMKFALGVNKSRLEPLYNVIKDEIKTVPEYQEYYNEYSTLLRKYSTKPKDGGDVVKQDLKTGGTEVNIDDTKATEFNKEINQLREKYKSTIEQVNKFESEFQEYLNGEIEDNLLPNIIKVSVDNIPYDVYNTDDHFYLIAFMVKD